MLAKVWKKALLVICILACLYNIMYKLVNRASLEVQLKSVQDQNSLINFEDNNITENKTQINSSEKDNDSIKENDEEASENSNTIVVIY